MILPLEQMVTSKGLSERLKKFGVPQDSCFYWRRGDVRKTYKWEISNRKMRSIGGTFSAYLESEIGVLLPWEIKLNKYDEVYLQMSKDEDDFVIWYEGVDKNGAEYKWESIIDKSSAEAKGLMLEYLLVNGLIKL